MSATETRERERLVRTFELPLADAWDGRTLDMRIVPYNQPATVSDPPDFRPYREMFMPGAFERQLTTPGRDRVFLNVEHEQGIRGIVGHSLRFADGHDGLTASFAVHENSDGDKALLLVREKMLTGLSLEFAALSSRRVDGVVQRHRAQLDKVSLCRYPAYEGAGVLAVRDEPDETDELDHDDHPPQATALERSSAVDELLAGVGFARLDDRMTPDELAAAATLLARRRGGAEKAADARKLIRYYNQAGLEAPASLRAIARSA